MRRLKTLVICSFLAIILIECDGWAAEKTAFPFTKSDSQSGPQQTILVVPFDHDNSPNAPLVAARSTWIVAKKLQAGKLRVKSFSEGSSIPANLSWQNRSISDEYFRSASVDWLVSGQVEKIGIERSGEWKGQRFLGMAGIPVTCSLTGRLYDCHKKEDIFEKTIKPVIYAPRLRILGMNRNPYPRTPRVIDAFIHDSLVALSQEILLAIKEGIKEGNQ